MLPIRSAIALHLRPTAHILRLKNPTANWTNVDHLLAEAFTRMQDETCPQCGQPIWLCRSNDPNLQWKVRSDTCSASAEKEKYDEKESAKKGKKKYGQFHYLEPYTVFGDPIPTRDAFFEALANPLD